MSKVVKGAALAAGILFTAGALAFVAPAIFAYTATWTIASSLATGAFLSGVSAQLASRKAPRYTLDVEYAGTIEPRRILYGFNRVSGMHALGPLTTGTNNKFLHKVLVLAGHQVNAISAIYFSQEAVGTIAAVSGSSGDGLVSTGTFANRAWVRRYLGTSTQTADFILDSALTVWTSDHRLRGLAYVATQKELDDKVWQQGETTDTFDVEGKLCYDPRLDTSPGANPTSGTYKAYTRNSTLQRADYLIDDVLGLGEDPARIDWDMVVTAADIDDELVAIPTATTQARYRGDLALIATDPYEDNILSLSACNLGSSLYSSGKWRLRSGAWETASFEITDSNVMGPLELDTAFPYKERWNSIRGSFRDPASNYQQNEFPPISVPSYVTADNGETVWKEVAFDAINVYEAQRKAIYLARKSRNGEVATIPCDLSLWRVRPGDTGIATIAELGWVNEQIRCESWGFTPDGLVALRVRVEAASDWDDPLEADYLTPLAVTTPTRSYFTPDAPSGLSAVSVSGGISFSWTAPALMPSTAEYELWEYTASTPFASASMVWHGAATTCRIDRLDSAIKYYWIRARMQDGTAGPTDPTSAGLAAGPGASNDLGLVATGNCVTNLYTATKSGGANAWDSQIYSAWSYKNGAFAGFRVNDINKYFVVGLNEDPTTNADATSVDFAWYCDTPTSGNWLFTESGVNTSSGLPVVAGDDMAISYDGAMVRYLRNGVVAREVIVGPDKKFFLDSSFYSPNAAIADIRFGPYGAATPVIFNARGNCVVSDTNAQKLGGSSAWDSDIYSLRGFASCHLSWKFNDNAHQIMVGLSSDPLVDLGYTSIDFAIYAEVSGAVKIYEAGAYVSTIAASVFQSDLYAITYDGSTVTYWRNGASVRTVSASGLTLFVDSSFNEPGGGINSLNFGPTTNLAVVDTPQIGDNAATDYGSMAASSGSFNSTTYSGAPTTLDQTIGSSLTYTNNTPVTQTVEVFVTCRFSVSGAGGGWNVRPKFLGTYPQGSIGGRTVADDEPYSYNASVSVASGASATFTLAAHWANAGTGSTGMTFSYADALLKYNVLKK